MKPLKSKNLDKHLLNTISYFAFFGYPPTFSEILTFFPEKITKTKLKMLLESLLKQKRLISYQHTPSYPSSQSNFLSSRPKWRHLFARNVNLGYSNNPKPPRFQISNFKFQINVYTLPQYAPHFKNRAIRQHITLKKLDSINQLIESLQFCPWVKFVGISGSTAMGNCTPGSDIDFFIITSRHHLYLARLWILLMALMLGLKKPKNGACFNLFFTEDDLRIPKSKQTPYVAHEVLQMKPVVNKSQIYERFLKANEWVYEIYPNSKVPTRGRSTFGRKGQNVFVNVLRYTLHVTRPIEYVLKKLQLAIIRRNKTGLIISPTQLWLFKKDFEKKMTSQTSRYI